MLPEDNDTLKKLKKEQERLKKITPDNESDDTLDEQDTLGKLKKTMDELKNPFKK